MPEFDAAVPLRAAPERRGPALITHPIIWHFAQINRRLWLAWLRNVAQMVRSELERRLSCDSFSFMGRTHGLALLVFICSRPGQKQGARGGKPSARVP